MEADAISNHESHPRGRRRQNAFLSSAAPPHVLGWHAQSTSGSGDVSHLISSDSDSEGKSHRSPLTRRRRGPAPRIVSSRYFLPKNKPTDNVAHLISSDSDDAEDGVGGKQHSPSPRIRQRRKHGQTSSSDLEQSMSTTQEFLRQHGNSSTGNSDYVSQETAAIDSEDGHTTQTELPEGWYLYHDEAGFPYYYNDDTGESLWELPKNAASSAAVWPETSIAVDTEELHQKHGQNSSIAVDGVQDRQATSTNRNTAWGNGDSERQEPHFSTEQLRQWSAAHPDVGVVLERCEAIDSLKHDMFRRLSAGDSAGANQLAKQLLNEYLKISS